MRLVRVTLVVTAPPAWLPFDRFPLAIPLVVPPTVSLEVPSTDSAVLDYVPAGRRRAMSANVNVDATVSSRLMGM